MNRTLLITIVVLLLFPFGGGISIVRGAGKGTAKETVVGKSQHSLPIYYIGGTKLTDGTQEAAKELSGDYILKGYILQCVCPNANTPVTWTFKKNGQEVGDFHDGYAWADYKTTLPAKPTSGTVYWRSDTAGSITDQYIITATGQGQQQVTRTLTSRSLNPSDKAVRDHFCEDVDMLQRALIQMCYLNCGGLDKYVIGKYQKCTKTSYFYTIHGQMIQKKFAAVANEVYNFSQWTNSGSSYRVTLQMLQRLWAEYAKVMAPGQQTDPISAASDPTAQWYVQARQTAVTEAGLTTPAKNAVDVLDAIFLKEYLRGHCGGIGAPLYWINVNMGRYDKPFWWYTTGDVGWGQLKPGTADDVLSWNPGKTWNLYDSQGNMNLTAGYLKKMLEGVDVAGANAKLWHAINKYHYGAAHYGQQATLDPQTARAHGYTYADDVFTGVSWTPPNLKTD